MRVETFCDLINAWEASTTLGKIFFFWLFAIGWFFLLIVALYLATITSIGRTVGFLEYEES